MMRGRMLLNKYWYKVKLLGREQETHNVCCSVVTCRGYFSWWLLCSYQKKLIDYHENQSCNYKPLLTCWYYCGFRCNLVDHAVSLTKIWYPINTALWTYSFAVLLCCLARCHLVSPILISNMKLQQNYPSKPIQEAYEDNSDFWLIHEFFLCLMFFVDLAGIDFFLILKLLVLKGNFKLPSMGSLNFCLCISSVTKEEFRLIAKERYGWW